MEREVVWEAFPTCRIPLPGLGCATGHGEASTRGTSLQEKGPFPLGTSAPCPQTRSDWVSLSPASSVPNMSPKAGGLPGARSLGLIGWQGRHHACTRGRV